MIKQNAFGSVILLAPRNRKPGDDGRVIVAHLHALFASFDLARSCYPTTVVKILQRVMHRYTSRQPNDLFRDNFIQTMKYL